MLQGNLYRYRQTMEKLRQDIKNVSTSSYDISMTSDTLQTLREGIISYMRFLPNMEAYELYRDIIKIHQSVKSSQKHVDVSHREGNTLINFPNAHHAVELVDESSSEYSNKQSYKNQISRGSTKQTLHTMTVQESYANLKQHKGLK